MAEKIATKRCSPPRDRKPCIRSGFHNGRATDVRRPVSPVALLPHGRRNLSVIIRVLFGTSPYFLRSLVNEENRGAVFR